MSTLAAAREHNAETVSHSDLIAHASESEGMITNQNVNRVLIVSPHFPPVNCADMHRVRIVIPFLRRSGWEVEVLTVCPDDVAAPKDNWLSVGLPNDVSIHRVSALSLSWSGIPGLGNLGFRAILPLFWRGYRLLSERRFDLVYFSTTVFETHILGPLWKRKFRVPFAIDYQDPWVSDYYREHPHVTPPGGWLKYNAINRLHRLLEPRVLRRCAGITSVSAAYPKQIRQRYTFLPKKWPVEVLPFPASVRDIRRSADGNSGQRFFDSADGNVHWVYIGRAGGDLALAIGGFFAALQQHFVEDLVLKAQLRLHFIGTSYAAAGKGEHSVLQLAKKYDLRENVTERTDRIPYSTTLRCLHDAHALIAFGSDDPAYTASKIYPYLMVGKPLLAIFHRESSVSSLLRTMGGGLSVSFESGESAQSLGKRIRTAFLRPEAYNRRVPLSAEFELAYGERAQASKLIKFFNKCREEP